MTYTLNRLAAGSFDLVLDGVIIGSVVREVSADGGGRRWHAELLKDVSPEQRPYPFENTEHAFRTLDLVTAWLGGAELINQDEELHSSGATA